MTAPPIHRDGGDPRGPRLAPRVHSTYASCETMRGRASEESLTTAADPTAHRLVGQPSAVGHGPFASPMARAAPAGRVHAGTASVEHPRHDRRTRLDRSIFGWPVAAPAF